jgi:hypothetical protein
MEPDKAVKNKRKKQPKGEKCFINIPWEVLRSVAYIGLSLGARAMLIEFVLQFNGRNNGHLHAARSYLKNRGWKSNETIQRQTNELVDAGLIVQTRTGGLNAGPHRYAMTWRKIDDFKNLDIKTFRVGKWQEKNAESRPTTGQGKHGHKAWRQVREQETSPVIVPETQILDKTTSPTIGHNVDYLPWGTGSEAAVISPIGNEIPICSA